MQEYNEKINNFVSLQIERFFDFKVWFAMKDDTQPKWIVRAYFREYFSSLLFDLTKLWIAIINIFWEDSEKVFIMLSDFPVEYIEKLAKFWIDFFNDFTFIKDDLDAILDKHRIKYDYILLFLKYLDDK